MGNSRLFLILLFLLISAFTFEASAQIQKHNLMVGGNGTYVKRYRHNIDPVTNLPQGISISTLNLNPSLSYFIIDNLGVGFSGSFIYNKVLDRENTNLMSDDHSYAVGPMVRYYFPFQKWAIFPEAQFLIRSGKSNSYHSGNKWTNQTSGSILKIGVGTSYFISPNVGIEGLLSYSSNNLSIQNGLPNTSVVTNGVNFNIGIQYYFSLLNRDK